MGETREWLEENGCTGRVYCTASQLYVASRCVGCTDCHSFDDGDASDYEGEWSAERIERLKKAWPDAVEGLE